jgi:hypothetical protein
MQNHIDDFVVLAYVLGRNRHKLVDHFGEELDISVGVVSYPAYKLSGAVFMLKTMLRTRLSSESGQLAE